MSTREYKYPRIFRKDTEIRSNEMGSESEVAGATCDDRWVSYKNRAILSYLVRVRSN